MIVHVTIHFVCMDQQTWSFEFKIIFVPPILYTSAVDPIPYVTEILLEGRCMAKGPGLFFLNAERRLKPGLLAIHV